MSKIKGTPLTNEEVLKLINLVEDNPVVFSRSTNASNNLLKESAWNKICNSFNAVVSSSPRKPEQLRLKWENLKKAARKRNARIRMNNLKTGGGKADYIPPDEALDRVAAILGPTCDGYTVPFGGDAADTVEATADPEDLCEIVVVLPDSDGCEAPTREDIAGEATSSHETRPSMPPSDARPVARKKFFFNSNKRKVKQQQNDEGAAIRIRRNLAIAEYYEAKKHEVELEQKKKKVEYEIMLLQKQKLEMEILNLTSKQTDMDE